MINVELASILICPICNDKLVQRERSSELLCHADSIAFVVRDDIPIMLQNEAREILSNKEVD